ncbi:hypothetical protein B0H10DRAFT_750942 [Mycena sp. CBHHK59/15]|nr:hypothetical protein B0H10DRAFT_750942 [Mycena sp. CBHHK59/15]
MSVARNFERNHMNWRQGLKKGGGASTIVHAEDSQPNETIDKRRAVPALVVPSKLQKRPNDSGWGLRGRGRGRGRGGPPNYADRRSAQYANSNAPQNPPKHIDFSRSLPVSSGPAKSAVFNSRGLQAPPNLSKGAIAPRPQPPQQRPLGATTGASRPRPPPRREPSPKPPHVPEGDPTVPISILDTFPGRLPSPSAARYSIRSSVSSIPRSPPPLKRRKFDGVSAVESIVVVPLPTSSDKAGAFLAPRPAYEKIQSKRTPAIPTSDTSQGRFLSPSASPASRILSVSSVPRSSPPLKRRRVDSVPPSRLKSPPPF